MKPKTGNRKLETGCLRGQAAAEYLVTYGWALLLLVAVIAIILSTGVFNPSYFISEECVLQPDISCTGHQMYRGGGDTVLLVRVENRLGYEMELDKVTATTTGFGQAGEQTWNGDITDRKRLLPGENATVKFTFRGEEQPPVGSIERVGISLDYYSCAREVDPGCEGHNSKHTISGRVTARIESE